MNQNRKCRTCLKGFDSNSFTVKLSTYEKTNCMTLRDKLKTCIPELALDLCEEYEICTSCNYMLGVCYKFRLACLEADKEFSVSSSEVKVESDVIIPSSVNYEDQQVEIIGTHQAPVNQSPIQFHIKISNNETQDNIQQQNVCEFSFRSNINTNTSQTINTSNLTAAPVLVNSKTSTVNKDLKVINAQTKNLNVYPQPKITSVQSQGKTVKFQPSDTNVIIQSQNSSNMFKPIIQTTHHVDGNLSGKQKNIEAQKYVILPNFHTQTKSVNVHSQPKITSVQSHGKTLNFQTSDKNVIIQSKSNVFKPIIQTPHVDGDLSGISRNNERRESVVQPNFRILSTCIIDNESPLDELLSNNTKQIRYETSAHWRDSSDTDEEIDVLNTDSDVGEEDVDVQIVDLPDDSVVDLTDSDTVISPAVACNETYLQLIIDKNTHLKDFKATDFICSLVIPKFDDSPNQPSKQLICTCKHCYKKFNCKTALLTHIQSHFNIGPFICTISDCDRNFFDEYQLKQHMTVHKRKGKTENDNLNQTLKDNEINTDAIRKIQQEETPTRKAGTDETKKDVKTKYKSRIGYCKATCDPQSIPELVMETNEEQIKDVISSAYKFKGQTIYRNVSRAPHVLIFEFITKRKHCHMCKISFNTNKIAEDHCNKHCNVCYKIKSENNHQHKMKVKTGLNSVMIYCYDCANYYSRAHFVYGGHFNDRKCVLLCCFCRASLDPASYTLHLKTCHFMKRNDTISSKSETNTNNSKKNSKVNCIVSGDKKSKLFIDKTDNKSNTSLLSKRNQSVSVKSFTICKCRACDTQCKTLGSLMYHIRYVHKLNKAEYMKKYKVLLPLGAGRQECLSTLCCRACRTNCKSLFDLTCHIKGHGISREEYLRRYNVNLPLHKVDKKSDSKLKEVNEKQSTTNREKTALLRKKYETKVIKNKINQILLYKCPKCHRYFSGRNIETHECKRILNNVSVSQSVLCKECFNKYATRTSYMRHKCVKDKGLRLESIEKINSIKPKPVTTQVDNLTININTPNKDTTNKHQFKCNICKTSYATKTAYAVHNCINRQGERIFRCQICFETFTHIDFIEHMKEHMGTSSSPADDEEAVDVISFD